ncbi:MAG: aminotransferase class I/II-fold pyridoxal phosphate-dependent enzyme [Chitinophagales bacterium]|nr:aminotransferase class I/II-fold pyridoxal phosphate-dependent enzyme [Chitinophagales bacterium]
MNLPVKHSAKGTTIFTVMSALATEHNAINLSQGFPDFPVDEKLGVLLGESVQKGFNQYAPMTGLPMLREAIAADVQRRYNTPVDANDVTVTPGATYGIYTAFTSILQKGDEVIVLEPAYDSYIPNIETNGAVVVSVPLSAPMFTVDWNKVKDAITDKTRAIIINTPHNPTGAVWTKEDWDSLAEILRGTDIILLSDEVYEQLVFDGKQHHSVLQHEELRQRSFAIYSFGKVYHNTGWKMGFVIAPPQLSAAFRSIHQFLVFSVNTPAQYALAQYLSQPVLPDVANMMQRKRDYFLDLLKDTPFKVHQPAGGSYFQTVDYSRISDMPDTEFAKWLTVEHGVATIPISVFYSNKQDDRIIRFCFAKKEETLKAAVDKLSVIKMPTL